MKKQKKVWRSPSLGKEMEISIYGSGGTPVLAIPTRGKSCEQWERNNLTESISFQLENGFNQLYCIDSADEESFFNRQLSPKQRVFRHEQYESYIIEEVIPFIADYNPIKFLIVAGMDMGGYHALNLGLKHPQKFGKVIGISGVYDIREFMGEYYDNNVYFNNPVDYIPNLTNKKLLDMIRRVDIRLVSYQNDPKKEITYRMGDIFRSKLIDHQLDVWQMETDEEWDLWRQMLKTHII